MNHIFETKRLLVRKLISSDLNNFHKMQSNLNVMKFVRPEAMTFSENEKELKNTLFLFYYFINRKIHFSKQTELQWLRNPKKINPKFIIHLKV